MEIDVSLCDLTGVACFAAFQNTSNHERYLPEKGLALSGIVSLAQQSFNSTPASLKDLALKVTSAVLGAYRAFSAMVCCYALRDLITQESGSKAVNAGYTCAGMIVMNRILAFAQQKLNAYLEL